MPKSLGGLVGWTVSTLVVVAVGLFILSRIPPVWRIIFPTPSA